MGSNGDPTVSTLSANDGVLAILVSYVGSLPKDEVRKLTQTAARSIVDRLAYSLNLFLSDPKLTVGSLTIYRPDGFNDSFDNTGATMRTVVGGNATITLGLGDRTVDLKNTLEAPKMHYEGKFDLFRRALGISDLVVKYLLLYLLLMSAHDDEQTGVEQFIRTNEKNVQETNTLPNGCQFLKETVCSRLRNQIGHNRQVPLESTRTEMEANMHGLMELVKICIRTKAF